jgi:transcription antitermination factor NusG
MEDRQLSGYWAVVQTEAQHERLVRLLLMRASYETYMPRIRQRSRIALLFPTYLFVRVVARWYPVRWTPGVLHVLMDGERPARLGDDIIDQIRKREVGGFVRLPKRPTLRKGARVRVLSGQFCGHIGLYDGMAAKERERVLLDLLGRMVPVELARGDRVEPLQDVASTI